MKNPCTAIDQLSAAGNWDDVFSCLKIDTNSTVELRSLKSIFHNRDDSWLDESKAINNSLEIILFVILLCDQIFYIALLWYLALFAFKYLRHRGRKLFQKLKIKKWQFGYDRSAK